MQRGRDMKRGRDMNRGREKEGERKRNRERERKKERKARERERKMMKGRGREKITEEDCEVQEWRQWSILLKGDLRNKRRHRRVRAIPGDTVNLYRQSQVGSRSHFPWSEHSFLF